MMKNKIQNLTGTALMAAILCIIGPVMIPVGVIPLSLANMVVYLIILLLGKRKAGISVVIYLLLGAVGIPVFSGFGAGIGIIFGPTGGYLIGYLVLCWISGTILEKIYLNGKRRNEKNIEQKKKEKCNKMGKELLSLVAGTVGLYFWGTCWLMFQANMSFASALAVGVVPFLVFDIIKMILAISLANSIKKRIKFML